MDIQMYYARTVDQLRAYRDTAFRRLGVDSAGYHIDEASRKNFYFAYAHLFSDCFPRVKDEDICKLDLAGIMYFHYLVEFDRILDGVPTNNVKSSLFTSLLHEESLRICYSLFPPDSPFWEKFQQYKLEMLNAILMERKNRDIVPVEYPIETMETIGAHKSAMAKAATAGLAVLEGDHAPLSALERSQELFHIGLQLTDDLYDWRRDYRDKNYSYLLWKVIIAHGLLNDVNSRNRPDEESIGRMMYFSGAAEYVLDLAEKYFERASHEVESLNCKDWKKVIHDHRKQSQRLANDLSALRKKELGRHQKGHVKGAKLSHDNIEHIRQSLESAMRFSTAQLSERGVWSDFLTNAGESTDWVTGYVGHCLSRCSRADSVLIKAVSALQQDRFPTGGWGYSRTVVVDADSTAACVRFLKSMGKNASELSNDLEILKAHQKSDGGFSTYASPTQIRHVIRASQEEQLNGWCSSHLCVTAVAVQALIECGISTENLEVEKAVDFILSRQHPDGYWESYWWDGCIYGTAHSIMALTRTDKRACLEPVEKAVRWLLEVQQKDGGWNNGIEGESKPFHTALAVQALLLPYSSEVAGSIEKGIRWLLTHQLTDGSWMSYPILRVPEPDCLTPWEKTDWRHSSVGTGIIVEDHNRLFTTATVLTTLAGYSQIV